MRISTERDGQMVKLKKGLAGQRTATSTFSIPAQLVPQLIAELAIHHAEAYHEYRETSGKIEIAKIQNMGGVTK